MLRDRFYAAGIDIRGSMTLVEMKPNNSPAINKLEPFAPVS